ncbi:Charged multivesicular body protein 2A [Nowakowskiella sp. JEL0078]|nr:Charged multivesicular body protein 2A [Nowakowskiella sp. JEL0078]
MADAMKGVTKAMKSMNKQVNMPQISKIMMDFERESELMDMKEEMMNDAIDDVMEEEEDEAESDKIVDQVLDEIGISFNESLVDAPTSKLGTATKQKVPSEAVLESEDADLQARLDNLRRGE